MHIRYKYVFRTYMLCGLQIFSPISMPVFSLSSFPLAGWGRDRGGGSWDRLAWAHRHIPPWRYSFHCLNYNAIWNICFILRFVFICIRGHLYEDACWAEEGVSSLSWSGCEPPNMGTGNETWGFQENRECSWPLIHLSSPSTKVLNLDEVQFVNILFCCLASAWLAYGHRNDVPYTFTTQKHIPLLWCTCLVVLRICSPGPAHTRLAPYSWTASLAQYTFQRVIVLTTALWGKAALHRPSSGKVQ